MSTSDLRSDQPARTRWQRWKQGISRNVVVLGLTGLFTDMSSEMILPVRFIFLVRWLFLDLYVAAWIEGCAEALSSVLKVLVGKRADRVPRRKPLIVAGYTISNLAKPLIGFVHSALPALSFVVLDRFGKAIRGAPRDKLIADSTPPAFRGKAFGFYRSFDTLGAGLGPLSAAIILSLTNNDVPQVFRWALLPGLLSILVLVLFLREHPAAPAAPPAPPAPSAAAPASSQARIGWQFWAFTGIWFLFSLGNSSDSFVFLRSMDLDSQLARLPVYYAAMNVSFALLATPLGALSDRLGRLPLLIAGLLVFAGIYVGWSLASANHWWQLALLFLGYGVYYAATHGVARAFVADLAPRSRRGTVMGWFDALTGLAALPANLIAAYLWQNQSIAAPFYYGAAMAFAAALLLLLSARWLAKPEALHLRS